MPTNASPKKIAAVVPTHNRLAMLKDCITAMRGQTRKLDEIIVVNNGCTDGTGEWLASQSDLTFVKQDNLGSAGGFYAGLKLACQTAMTGFGARMTIQARLRKPWNF